MKSLAKIFGEAELVIRHKDAEGVVLDQTRQLIKNLIVDAGEDLIASVFGSTGATRPGWIAVGGDNTSSTASMTALQGTEHARKAISAAVADNTVTYTVTFSTEFGGTVSVGEIGIFTASAAGTMLSRLVTDSFSISDGDELDISWGVTFKGD